MKSSALPPRTPGSLGSNDAADPAAVALPGDTPGPVGTGGDAASHLADGLNLAAAAVPAGQDPKIVDVLRPSKFSNGGYIWLVRFELRTAAAADGWIVQEFFKSILHTQAGADSPRTFHYWEAWPVGRGSKEITDPAYWATFQNSPKFNDVFGDLMPSGSIPVYSAGSITIQAAARFYERDLPSTFVKQLPGGLGQELPQSYIKPAFWRGPGTFRYLHYAWDFSATPAFPSPVLRTATSASRAVFPGSINVPQGIHTWP